MRRIVVFLLFALPFGCIGEDNKKVNLDLNFRNEIGSDLQNNKVYFLENYTIAHDTLSFDLQSNQEKNIFYEYSPKGGEGRYALMIGKKIIPFGYYPSTLANGDNIFYFKIQKDTVLISQRKEGFW